GILNALATALHGSIRAVPSIHRLWLGLLGYLIPFAPLAFVSQCQCRPSRVLSPLVFFPISTHFTAPPEIPSAPTVLQLGSFHRLSRVEPWDLTANLKSHLQTLYAQSFRITLEARGRDIAAFHLKEDLTLSFRLSRTTWLGLTRSIAAWLGWIALNRDAFSGSLSALQALTLHQALSLFFFSNVRQIATIHQNPCLRRHIEAGRILHPSPVASPNQPVFLVSPSRCTRTSPTPPTTPHRSCPNVLNCRTGEGSSCYSLTPAQHTRRTLRRFTARCSPPLFCVRRLTPAHCSCSNSTSASVLHCVCLPCLSPLFCTADLLQFCPCSL
ncbi:hypothetical protein S83_019855, partial [Arachis hypogaea]